LGYCLGRNPHFEQNLGCNAFALLQKSQQQVLNLDLAMIAHFRQFLGGQDGLLGHLCVLVEIHLTIILTVQFKSLTLASQCALQGKRSVTEQRSYPSRLG
jgi:hypothetical protein